MIPTQEDNPKGLHQRYKVLMADGSEPDPQAVYFVLRLDSHGDDPANIAACRHAIGAYCRFINAAPHSKYGHLYGMADDLYDLLVKLED